MADTTQIFISYARSDSRDLALQLRDDLMREGFGVWVDTFGIQAGADWSSTIETAIDECQVALVLISEGSNQSTICRNEQLRCLDKHKRVIPLIVQPKVTPPLHLYSLNYRNFSNPSNYGDTFSILVNDLKTHDLDTQSSSATAKLSAYLDRMPVAELMLQSCQNHVKTSVSYSDYNPDMYAPRDRESLFQRFLQSDKTCLPLLGDLGMGKSYLLYHLAAQYQQTGYCAILEAKQLTTTPEGLDRAVVQHFDPEVGEPSEYVPLLPLYMRQFQGLLKKPLVIFIDGLNENPQPKTLLTNISQLMLDCAGLNIKLVITCQTETWTSAWSSLRLEHKLPATLFYGLETARELTTGISDAIHLGLYSDRELEAAYGKLKLKPGWEQVQKAQQVIDWLRDPLMLWIVAEIYTADPVGEIPLNLPPHDVMEKYLLHIQSKAGMTDIIDETLVKLIDEMRKGQQSSMAEEALEASGIPTGAGSVIAKLVDLGLLKRVPSQSGSDKTRIFFSKERFLEYLLYRRLASTQPANQLTSTSVMQLLDELYDFAFIWGALLYWFNYDWPTSLLKDLSQNTSIQARSFLVALCQIKTREAGEAVRDLLTASMSGENLESKLFAVMAGYASQNREILEGALIDPADSI